jgi:L-amino acid N-acyltransferase YncA
MMLFTFFLPSPRRACCAVPVRGGVETLAGAERASRRSGSPARGTALGTLASVLVRVATADDWPSIWPFFEQIVAAGETYAYPDDLTSEAARDLWMEPPPGHTAVAEESGVIVGSAKMGPNRPARGAHVSTASFMVNPDARGRGVGRLLVDYALAWARAEGFHSMQFNAVVETNVAAVRLWQAVGFEIVGTVPEAFDHPKAGLVGLHVMYRRL